MSATRKILQSLFATEEPPRRFGTVVSILLVSGEESSYTVLTDAGARLTVDGPSGYLPGNSVRIQSGRIVASGTRPGVKRTFRV